MKKVYKLSIIAMLLLLSLAGSAQTWNLIEEVPNSFQSDVSIVRYWKDSIFVSCNRDLQGRYVFSLIQKNSTTCFQVWNNQDYVSISDFQIYKDEVFLCGTSRIGNDLFSVFGRFNINDLFSPPVNFESIKFESGTLSKMVVYKESNGVHIVAIGNDSRFQPERGVLAECYYDNSHGFYGLKWYSVDGILPAPRFKDIVVTNKYVTVVAEDWEICLYRCLKNDIASGITSYEYHYPTGYYEPNRSLSATAMYDDVIATSCYARINLTQNWSENIRLFDISTMDMIDAQTIPMSYKGENQDIVYLPFDRTLVVSFSQAEVEETDLVHVTPFMSSSYYADRIEISEPYWFFDGLEVAEGRFVISGYSNKWFVNDMSSYASQCCNWTRRKVVPIIVAPTHIEPSLYHQESPVYTTNGRRVNPQITPINILCNQ